MTKVDQVIEQCTKLDDVDLCKVRATINRLLALPLVDTGPQPGLDSKLLPLFRGLSEVLQEAGCGRWQIEQIRKSREYPRARPEALKLLALYDAQVDDFGQRQMLIRQAWKLLRQDLEKMGIAVTATVMLRHIVRVPAVLHRELPGYSCGMFRMLGRRTRNANEQRRARNEPSFGR